MFVMLDFPFLFLISVENYLSSLYENLSLRNYEIRKNCTNLVSFRFDLLVQN